MQHVIITSMCYLKHYHTFSLSAAWFWAICNALSRVTVKFIRKIHTNIFLKKMMVTHGNALQIAQNQENLRENRW